MSCALALLCLAATLWQSEAAADARDIPEARSGDVRPSPIEAERLARMAGVRSWGYQLRYVNPRDIAASSFDLLVVDHAMAANRRFVRELSPGEIATMQRKPDGSKRIVLAYLSIGEAERYRFYWVDDWHDPARAPSWLGPENPRWPGNYRVAYWEKSWQDLLFGSPGAYVERLMAQGFDGVYLDRADIFEEWAKEVPDAAARMADFVTRLVAHARAKAPGFLAVMQNGEELLRKENLLRSIDGFAKEDLFFGITHEETANRPEDVEWSYELMRMAQGAGRRILVVEYLADPQLAVATAARIADLGFVPYIGTRELDQLNTVPHLPLADAAR